MKKLFNDNWQFKLLEIESDIDEAINGGGWYNIEMPHDWLIFDSNNLYKTGEGWYRKSFFTEKNDNVYTLIFDGVYMDTVVFVNGAEAGEWKYGYSAFSFDVSDFIKSGENIITVRVRYESPNTRWYSGAGIFRNVFLNVQKKCRIINDGIYFSAENQNNGSWIIHAETEFRGCSNDTPSSVRYTLLDKSGENFVFFADKLECNDEVFKAVGNACINNPVLWDIKNPYLYVLTVELIDGGNVTDCESLNIGFRETEFSPQNGFFLNGKQLKLHGVCMHHDLGALGAAFNVNALRRQLDILREMGVNAIRTSHNPPAREFMDLCDEMGFLVDSEIFDMWELPKTEKDYSRFFPEWYKKDVESWVRRDRNHPCLIMWSIGNEIYDTHKDERGLEVTKLLKTEVLKHDPYKNASVTVASNFMAGENAQKCADAVTLAGYNYAENLYEEHHKKNPHRFIYGSETASCVRSRGVYHLPSDTPVLIHDDLQCSDMGNSVVGWGSSSERAWIDDRDREYCGGQFIWTGFDYIGEPTPYNTKNSYFGIVDTAGLPKSSFYFYKAVWNTDAKPFIKLFPHWDWNEGQTVNVFAYSNLPCAELFLNGVTLGKRCVDLNKDSVLHFSWSVKYHTGELLVKAYTENGCFVAEDKKVSFSEPVKITASCSDAPLYANGTDLMFIEISAVDVNNTPVENARNRIFVGLKGKAVRLVGLDSGDSTDFDSYQGNNKRLFGGKLIAILKTSLESGMAEVEFTANGLEKAIIKLNVLPCKIPEGVSVPKDNVFPASIQKADNSVYVRKIVLKADKTELNENSKTAFIKAEVLPPNTSFKEIEWKCVFDNGVESNLAEIETNGTEAVIKAKGDGNFRVRAFSRNGGVNPEVISELEFSIDGLGGVICSPYKFIPAECHTFSNYPQNIVNDGAVTGFHGKTIVGFSALDFGTFGTDSLLLYAGNCSDSVPVQLWEENPDDDNSVHLETFMFPQNNLWGSYAPVEFKLKKKLTGIKVLSFIFNTNCIFGGFKFIDKRAFVMNSITANDGIYGDEFRLFDNRIENIGNNVLIGFKGYDFGENGISKIYIDGRTVNSKNTINIRFKNIRGIQKTQLLEFDGCSDYIIRDFQIEKLCGLWDFEFVFLPGSNFDFKGFMFE